MPPVLHRRLAAGLATVATAGVLVGCGGGDDDTTSAASDSSTAAETTTEATAEETTTAAGDSAAATGEYKDGTYEAEGSYQSPAGEETVGVSLTLADGKVSAVTVTPQATDSNSVRFQGEFKDGISSEIVGKDLAEIEVSKVAGSSLTSGGFNQAVETIKTEAQG